MKHLRTDDGRALRLFSFSHTRLTARHDVAHLTELLGPGKPLALITFLALSPRRTASRDQLADLLWGDRDLEDARRQLRQTLWLIKQHDAAVSITSSPEGLSLTHDLAVDALEFVDAVGSGQLEKALELYTGDFFPGYAAPGAQRFEQWADLERGRFRSLAVHSAESLVRRALDAGRAADAARIARRLREVDPNGQSGWRLLIESLAATHDVVGTRAEADHFEAWLAQDDREIEPLSAATLKMARRLTVPVGGDASPDLVAELVGRGQQFAALHHAWQEARVRGSRRVHLVAEGGMGKTRLALDFCSRLRAARERAVYQRANPGERAIPLSFAAGIAAALAPLPGARGVSEGTANVLVALNPSLSSTFANARPERVLHSRAAGFALLELVTAVADDAPLALVLDDLHWADAQSRDVVSIIASRLAAERVLLVTSARPGYDLNGIVAGASEVHLPALTQAEVQALVSSLGRIPATPWAADFPALLFATSLGNPLNVLEALRLCLDRGLLVRTGGGWECPDPAALRATLSQSALLSRRLADLCTEERHLLLLLAVAAVPLPHALALSALGASLDAQTVAARLELGGFIISGPHTWAIAHDRIAESVVEAASAEDEARAHAALGAALAASLDSPSRRRAVPHLMQGGRFEEGLCLAARLVAAAGTRRVTGEDLAAVLGSEASDAHLSALRARLPVSLRHPWLRGSAVVAALILSAVTVPLIFSKDDDREDRAWLAVARERAAGTPRVRMVPLDREAWPSGRALVVQPPNERWTDFQGADNAHFTPRPGSDEWAALVVSPDSGQGDIYLRSAGAPARRFTFSRAQDIPVAFSPDGQQLLFHSTRWSARGYSSLAILDMRTGDARRLTHNAAGTDMSGAWSTDGSRIAFSRTFHDSSVHRVCVIDVDGGRERCGPHSPAPSIAGWSRDGRILYVADSGARGVLWSVVPGEWTRRTRLAEGVQVTHVDPAGDWLLVSRPRASVGTSYWVAPIDHVDRLREVQLAGDTSAPLVQFHTRGVPREYLDSVAIDTVGGVRAGVPHRLQVRGWTRGRTPAIPAAVTWSATGGNATIDESGVLVALDTGRVVVTASAGGWRSVTDTIVVRAPVAGLAFHETWSDTTYSRWRPFGIPFPRIVARDSGRNAFLNDGDGTFFSGAYLRHGIDGTGGVAMDFELSTPITATQWQVVILSLVALRDSTILHRWDHRTGYTVPAWRQGCGFAYPEGEGPRAPHRLAIIGDIAHAMGDPAFRVDDGSWWRVRLQRFPDGRCGVAINGRALIINPEAPTPMSPVYPMIQGSSVNTSILVGDVRVYRGVPGDVDWTALRLKSGRWLR